MHVGSVLAALWWPAAGRWRRRQAAGWQRNDGRQGSGGSGGSGSSGSGQCIISVTAAGIAAAAAATAVLPSRTAKVAMKTPVARAMAGAQTTIINQLKAARTTATATATMIAMTMTMKMKAAWEWQKDQVMWGLGGVRVPYRDVRN